MRPAKFYAGLITAIIAMFAIWAMLTGITITKTRTPPPQPAVSTPVIITTSAVDVKAPKPPVHFAKQKMRGPHHTITPGG